MMKKQKKKLSILNRFHSIQEQKMVNAAWPPTGPFTYLGPATGYEQQREEEEKARRQDRPVGKQQEYVPEETQEVAGADIYKNPLYTAYEKMLAADFLEPKERQAVEQVYNEWKQRISDIGRM